MSWPVPPHGFLGSQAATSDNDTYQIGKSLRFNSADSAYLNRTAGTPTNSKKWTWSGWVKRSKLGTYQGIFDGYTDGNSWTTLHFWNDNRIIFYNVASGVDTSIDTVAVFRDCSAWYHVVFVFDSDNATVADRAIIYVNGTRQMVTNTFGTITSGEQTYWNLSGFAQSLGRRADGGYYLDAYLAEINFIDGQALTPSSFGETDAITGRWKAKAYSGTYGANGFYLNFADNSGATATTLGKDSAPISGAHTTANNWTPNNLSVTPGVGNDSLVDSPSNYGAISTTLVNDTYQISKSLRFNSADSAYLNRTPASAGNRKTWTWSGWVKRGTLGGNNVFMGNTDASGYNGLYFQFDTNNNITIGDYGVGSYVWVLTTSQVFRDTSSWHHIVATYDSTQVTASDRVSVYINGTKITAFSTATYPSLNLDGRINSTQLTSIGRLGSYNGFYFDGYLAEVNFIDGQALTPTSFGTRDINTYLWKPKAYTGTYGTNGFYLNFSDSSNTTAATLGKDQAGSNNWTPNNFSVSAGPGNDSLVDSPTYYGTDTGVGGEVSGNYATLDPLNNSGVLSNGNLVFQTSTAATQVALGTSKIIPSGKTYFEVNVVTAAGAGTWFQVGIAPSGKNLASSIGTVSGNGYSIEQEQANDMQLRLNGSTVVISTVVQTGDVLQVAVDHATGKLWFGRNNIWYSSSGATTGNPAAGTNQSAIISTVADWFPAVAKYNTGGSYAINFGQRPFAYTAPSGFRALRDYNKLPTPTGGEVRGNYCTLNPLDFSCPGTISNGNLQYVQSTLNPRGGRSTMAVSSGKWYWEVTNNGGNNSVGIIRDTGALTSYIGANADGWSYFIDGLKYNNGTGTSYGASYTTNDVIGVALDMDARTLAFYKNGVSQGTAFSGLSGTMSPGFSSSSTSAVSFTVNFGQRPWAYDAPFGFLPLCTTLLPQPIIQKPSSYMDVVTYTGTGATQSITSLGFSPDLLWTKGRSLAQSHNLFDTLRSGQRLRSETTGAEAATTVTLGSSGFTLGAETESNNSGSTFVAWAWDESPIAGLDIVSYVGDGNSGRAISHGLGVAPKFILVKNRTIVSDWPVYHASLPASNLVFLHLTNATAAISVMAWGAVSSTSSSTFTVIAGNTDIRNVNKVSDNYIAYLFAEVEGFSKFGSYTGNGSADGPFVYCGFRPRWVMVKRTDNAFEHWQIQDSGRSVSNPAQNNLFPNSSQVEQIGAADRSYDFVSNGFKLRGDNTGTNGSGGTYIFAAFAESPFKYARAR